MYDTSMLAELIRAFSTSLICAYVYQFKQIFTHSNQSSQYIENAVYLKLSCIFEEFLFFSESSKYMNTVKVYDIYKYVKENLSWVNSRELYQNLMNDPN